MKQNCWFLFLFVILCVKICHGTEDISSTTSSDDAKVKKDSSKLSPNDEEIFVAEKEWKEIKAGQSIPAGLHVRMNLQTGKKEAKLMDDSESISGQLIATATESKDDAETDDKKTSFNINELKEVLKNIKAEELASSDEAKKVKEKFRNLKDLKKEFEELNLNIETDTDIMIRLLKRLNSSDVSNKDKVYILHDLEYFAHQIDNALNLIELNALDVIIPFLNSTESELRSASAFVLGSALQSNTKFKIEIVERNVLPHLVRLIALDSSANVKNKAMYALACLVRDFPYAQQKMIDNGALSVFAEFSTKHFDAQNLKISKKILSLLVDLIQEKESAMNSKILSDPLHEEKARQYSKLKIRESAVSLGICDMIPKLLPLSDDHDTVELIINAMQTFHHGCFDNFKLHEKKLQEFLKVYKDLSEKENQDGDGDEYFRNLYQSLQQLLKQMKTRYNDEL